jgi:hypothetical protein
MNRAPYWFCTLLVACGCSTTASLPDSADVHSDAPTVLDGDSALDVGADSAPDVGVDSAPDVGVDSAPDAGVDSSLDGWLSHDAAPLDASGPDLPPPDASKPDLSPSGLPLPALTSCGAPKPCATGGPVAGLFASYRKDAWLPAYTEVSAIPATGGRLQIAGVAQAAGTVDAVIVEGVDLGAALENPALTQAQNPVEWFHVWPEAVAVGDPIWVSFHSRDAAWDGKTKASLKVTLKGGGAAIVGSFPVQQTKIPLTYVTTSADLKTLLIHVKNEDTTPHTLKRLVVQGRDVTASACIPSTTVKPGEAVLWTVPLCAPLSLGAAWTVVAEYVGAPAAVGAGRVIRPFFPMEAWQNSDQCPFPGGKLADLKAFRGAGFDTFFLMGGMASACNVDLAQLVGTTLPATPDLHALGNEWTVSYPYPGTARMAAFMTGDESDGEIYESNGKPHAWTKAKDSNERWIKHPTVPTYNGAKTNRNVGTFAGIADIQGMDFYVAACAPHNTVALSYMDLRSSYDYLRNTRENHRPLPTWLYAQGLHKGWNAKQPLTGTLIHVQPDPQEILVQGMSVAAAGAKGMMWFQIARDEMLHSPARWQAISRVNWIVRGVRRHLREGDLTGMVKAPQNVLVEMIRAREALIVVVINLDVATKVDDTLCVMKYISEQSVPHWTVNAIAPAFSVQVPDDMTVVEAFEVEPQKTSPAAVSVKGREVTWSAVPLDNTTPVRLYVLAANPQVRPQVLADMVPVP